jgi:O-antigen/teichoic acid export membrane protein
MFSLVRKILKNASTLAFGSIFNSVLGLISFSLLARELGVELFGVIALVQVYATIVDRLINFQSWQALIKYGTPLQLKGDKEQLGELYSFGLVVDLVSAVFATLIGVVLPWAIVGSFLGWEELKILMASIFSISILFNIEGTPTAIFRMHDKYRVFVEKGAIAAGMKLILVIVGIALSQSLWYFFYAILIAQVLGYLYFFIASMRFLNKNDISLKLSSVFKNKVLYQNPGILSFILTTNLHGTTRMMTLQLDTVLVDTFLGSASTGLYQVAKQFARVFTQVSQPLYKVIYPELAKLWELKDIPVFKKMIARFSGFALLFGVLVWGLFYLFPEIIIKLSVGEEYLAAIPVLLAYLVGVLLSVAAFPFTPAILAMGFPKVSLTIQALSTIIYFVSLYFLIAQYGVLGAGIAYALLYFSWWVILIITYFSFLKEKLYAHA